MEAEEGNEEEEENPAKEDEKPARIWTRSNRALR
jgi:hypothetical protein